MSMADWFNRNFNAGPAVKTADGLTLVADMKRFLGLSPSRDEFAAWRDDPTTRFVMYALQRNADECRDEWLRLSWEGGEADQRKLDGLRERSDALLGFTADYEAFCETLNLEPEQEEQAA
jgi:hypothetical protein